MATLESVHHVVHRASVTHDSVIWVRSSGAPDIESLPQVFWGDATPWREANLWALQGASNQRTSIKTIWSAMKHLHAYAGWLEQECISWREFPIKEADRCLVRFRGFLIRKIRNSELAPSTCQQRMNAIIRFYRWLSENNLISNDLPLWNERTIEARFYDNIGFKRTITLKSTDLAIPNRKIAGEVLEDGLLPVSNKDAIDILHLANETASKELALFLHIAFGTGMRIRTISDLKIETIERAIPNPSMPGFFLMAVGPGARPPVSTKYGVSGHVLISEQLLTTLKEYIYSARRLKRVALAGENNKNLIFLTRFGNPYAQLGEDTSRPINVEMGRLRRRGIIKDIKTLYNFHFHQSRCTFATALARIAIKHGGASFAIKLVKDSLLHKNEITTLKYIRFVESESIKEKLSDEFTRQFLGIHDSAFSEQSKYEST